MRYEWKDSWGGSKDDAQRVGEYLDELSQKKGGGLTPQDVLKSAKPKKSPIHKYFAWDDTEAARKYREWQARQLVNHVVVIYEKDNSDQPETIAVRAFVNVTNRQEERKYTPIKDVMYDPQLRKQLLNKAKGELFTWRRKYKDLVEFSEVFDIIEKVA